MLSVISWLKITPKVEPSRFYSLLHHLERYVYLGDDRHIEHCFCSGKVIAKPRIC